MLQLSIYCQYNLQSIAGACLTLYLIIYHPELMADPVSLIMTLFWFLTGLLNLGIIAVGAAYVNHMVSTVMIY